MFQKIAFWWDCFTDDVWCWWDEKQEKWSRLTGKLYWHFHESDEE